MSASALIALVMLSALEGALVAAPQADAFSRLRKVRSPLWAAAPAGMILLGTFGVLAFQSMAFGLVVLAAVATPLLAAVALSSVVRIPRPVPGKRAGVVAIVVALAVGAVVARGWPAQLASTVLTALGSLAVGIAMACLIPHRWIPLGVLATCVADVVLLAAGVGEPAAALMNHAAAQFHGPTFDHATIGALSDDYPDLVLAAMLGGILAGDRPGQRRAGAILCGLSAVFGLLLTFVAIVPATLPIALTYVLARPWREAGRPVAVRRPATDGGLRAR